MNAGFQNKLKIKHLGGKNFELLARLTFYSEEYERTFITPKGFITDFASIPWFAQSFCQVLGNNIRSAVLHDWHCTPDGKTCNNVSQKDADAIFREGLRVDNVRASKVVLMSSGVGLFQRIKYLFKKEKYNG
jgi:hypothetical protein